MYSSASFKSAFVSMSPPSKAPGAGLNNPIPLNKSGRLIPMFNVSRPPIENPQTAVFSRPVSVEYSLLMAGINTFVKSLMM